MLPDTEGEEERNEEGLPRPAHFPVTDVADDEGDAGKVTGAEKNTQHPPDKGGGEGCEGRALDGFSQECEDFTHRI
jgi:hypothetical protein